MVEKGAGLGKETLNKTQNISNSLVIKKSYFSFLDIKVCIHLPIFENPRVLGQREPDILRRLRPPSWILLEKGASAGMMYCFAESLTSLHSSSIWQTISFKFAWPYPLDSNLSTRKPYISTSNNRCLYDRSYRRQNTLPVAFQVRPFVCSKYTNNGLGGSLK